MTLTVPVRGLVYPHWFARSPPVVDSLEPLGPHTKHSHPVFSDIAVTPDASRIVSTDFSGVTIWNAVQGHELHNGSQDGANLFGSFTPGRVVLHGLRCSRLVNRRLGGQTTCSWGVCLG